MTLIPAEHETSSAHTTVEDLQACYQLILAREPESEDVVASRVGAPFRGLVADFVGGDEFAARIARPLLEGRSPPQPYRETAAPELREWLERRLAVTPAKGAATVADLLSSLLRRLADENAARPAELLRAVARKLRQPSERPAVPDPVRERLVEAVLRSSENEVVASALGALALMDDVDGREGARKRPEPPWTDDRTLIRQSGLWEAAYYVKHNKLSLGGVDPLDHFLRKGGAAGLRPHPLFSTSVYIAKSPDVVAAGKNPLAHYLRHGWKEGRTPNLLFDPLWYGRRHGVEGEPLGHYALRGRALGLQPHPLFDGARYLEMNPDLSGLDVDPYTHYVEFGCDEGRAPFDARRLGSDLRIAVVAHVFHEELWPELSFHLAKLDRPFDLFVTLPAEAGGVMAEAIRAEWPTATVAEVPNAGRDIGPFLSVLPRLMRYDAVCKLHTKKGATDPATWRLLTFQGLLGSTELVGRILGWFEGDPALVLAGPNKFYMDGPWTLDANGPTLARVLRATLGHDAPLPTQWGFFAGTMFWFRPSLFQDLPCRALLSLLEEDDNIAHDSQSAHAVERLFGLAATLAQACVGLTDVTGPLPPPDLSVVPAGLHTSRDGLQGYLPQRRAQLVTSQVELQKPDRRTWLAPRGGQPGVNFIGPVEAVNGLGVSARGFVQALRAADIPVNVVPWRVGFDRVRMLEFEAPPCEVQPINIVHLNFDLLTGPRLLDFPPLREWVTPSFYNVAIVYWELPTIDPPWRWAIDRFDEVWTPSSFTREAVSASSDVTTRLVRPVVELAKRLVPERAPSFGLDTDAFIFFYSADAGSILHRKNPQAFWRAYAEEFAPDEGACCVVKLSYADKSDPLIREVAALSAARPDVRFIPDLLSYEDMAALFQRADCYVSPHRSEGLGLTLLEAMEAGKPVICTRYGGVSDFVTDETAFVIDHRLTEVGPGAEPYPQGYVWADPDHGSLRGRLRQVFGDPQAARAAGERGRATVDKLFGERQAAAVIREEIRRVWRKGGGTWREEPASAPGRLSEPPRRDNRRLTSS